MTASKQVNHSAIVTLYNRNRSYQSVRLKYNLNYNCITTLLAIYMYSITIGNVFDRYSIYKYINKLYSFKYITLYFDKYVKNGLMVITQRGNHKLYSLTDSGYSAIQEISDNADRLMYDFCSKYSIEL